jgi:hypothetical protein
MQDFQGAFEGRHAMEREGGYAMWAVEEKKTGTRNATHSCLISAVSVGHLGVIR